MNLFGSEIIHVYFPLFLKVFFKFYKTEKNHQNFITINKRNPFSAYGYISLRLRYFFLEEIVSKNELCILQNCSEILPHCESEYWIYRILNMSYYVCNFHCCYSSKWIMKKMMKPVIKIRASIALHIHHVLLQR